LWSEAEADGDYLVQVNVMRSGTVRYGNNDVLNWQYTLPAPGQQMVFSGFFELLGSWPFPANQLVGLFIRP